MKEHSSSRMPNNFSRPRFHNLHWERNAAVTTFGYPFSPPWLTPGHDAPSHFGSRHVGQSGCHRPVLLSSSPMRCDKSECQREEANTQADGKQTQTQHGRDFSYEKQSVFISERKRLKSIGNGAVRSVLDGEQDVERGLDRSSGPFEKRYVGIAPARGLDKDSRETAVGRKEAMPQVDGELAQTARDSHHGKLCHSLPERKKQRTVLNAALGSGLDAEQEVQRGLDKTSGGFERRNSGNVSVGLGPAKEVERDVSLAGIEPSDRILCHNLWEQLQQAMKQRERNLKRREHELLNLHIQIEKKTTLTESLKQEAAILRQEAAAFRSQAVQERVNLQMELQKLKGEREAMEHYSTDIAVQLAELKQAQREMEKEKASFILLKADLEKREKLLDEHEENSMRMNNHGCSVAPQKGLLSRHTTAGVSLEAGGFSESKSVAIPLNDFPCLPLVETHALIEVGKVPVSSVPVKTEPLDADGSEETRQGLCKLFSMHPDPGNIYYCDNSHVSQRAHDNADEGALALRSLIKNDELEGHSSVAESLQPRPGKQEGKLRKQENQTAGMQGKHDDKENDTEQISVESALEEDAPGLLEALREKGLLEGMQVYGNVLKGEEFVDVRIGVGSEFRDLEQLVGKIWKGSGFLSLPVQRQVGTGSCSKYCLPCLISLIEQTHSVQRRNWPVEWGWCRRLYSFIFVFEKHNRIVLERPEYGYATYFFEIVQGLAVDWQVQRLITVMSAASKGRAAILENRTLEVGTDLSTEEAVILEKFGWTPNSGLGSLLNYCERVVHDSKEKENDTIDWRVKIGKCLMDGYDRGSMLKVSKRHPDDTLGSGEEGCSAMLVKAESDAF